MPTAPYKSLGLRLLSLRQKVQESVAEVSGAVEIDVERLERIEQGLELPSEDILLLLINHFNVRDDEAMRLWELAGYDHDQQDRTDEQHTTKQPVVMLLSMDSRIIYTNGVEVVVDEASSDVVMNFTQPGGAAQQAMPVARLGMNRRQAERVLEALQGALMRADHLAQPKALPEPSQRNLQNKPKRPSKSKKQEE